MLQHAMQVNHFVACQSDNREAILHEMIAQFNEADYFRDD